MKPLSNMKRLLFLLSLFVYLAPGRLAAQAESTLIPFQGRLTDQNGTPITNGVFSVVFQLYTAPVGGEILWSERHERVGVLNGMVNVFLGSITPLANIDFSVTRHLGITVDIDQNANTPDVEMVPRQMIIPAFAAKQAERARTLDVLDVNGRPVQGQSYGWASVFGNGNPVTGSIPGNRLSPASVTAAQLAVDSVQAANIANGQITVAKLANEVAQLLVPAGAVSAFAGTNLTTPPTGWFFCDGSAVSRTTYAALFAAIGTAYGAGDGSTTFHLPDYRGMFLRGIANIPDLNITAVDTANETVTVANHPYRRNGMPVRFAGTPPGGLAVNTTYYTIYVDANRLAFAASEANATAANPVKVDIITVVSGGLLVQAVDPDSGTRRSVTGTSFDRNVSSTQGDTIKSHTHPITPSQINGIVRGLVPGGIYAIPPGINVSAFNGWDFKIGEFGGSETRPINIYVNYIIKF